MPAVCNYTFLCYLFFWYDVLRETNAAQIALQSKGLTVDETATKIEALRFYIEEKRDHIVEGAIDIATKKSEDYDIPTEKRLRRKKRMVGEMTSDAGLTLKEELQKDMLEYLDRFRVKLQTRSKSLQDFIVRYRTN